MRLLTIILLSLLIAKNVFSEDRMRPLAEIYENYSSNTKEAGLHFIAHVGLRCSGYFGAMAGLVGSKELAKVSVNMALASGVAESIGQKRNIELTFEEATSESLKIKDIYRKAMISNNIKNGNYYKGSRLLDSDHQSCKEMVPGILGFIKSKGVPLIK